MNQTNLEIPLGVESAEFVQPVQVNDAVGQSWSEKREELGLTVQEVSTRLKYSVKMVEALEARRWNDLPQGVALRGLIRNYARLLGIDSSGLETELQAQIGHVTGGIANHTSTRSLASHDPDRHARPTGWLLLIAMFVIAVLGIALWQGVVPKGVLPEWLGSLLK